MRTTRQPAQSTSKALTWKASPGFSSMAAQARSGPDRSPDASSPSVSSPGDAALAAAEREAFNDTETWGDDSDDEGFADRDAVAQLRHKEQLAAAAATAAAAGSSRPPLAHRGSVPERRGSGTPDTTGVPPPIAKRQVSLSGSGRGFWDIPTASGSGTGGGRGTLAGRSPRTPSVSLPHSSATNLPVPGSSGSASNGVAALPQPTTAAGVLPNKPELQKRKAPAAEEDCKRSIRSDFDDLMQDPVFALQRLKLEAEEEAASPTKATSAPSSALPWEAVLPPELVSPAPGDHADLPSEPSTPNSAGPAAGPSSGTIHQGLDQNVPVDRNAEIMQEKCQRRLKLFLECLSAPSVDISQLRKLAWAGIPDALRPIAWQLLLGYLPAPAERRKMVLKRKRQEYADAVKAAFSKGDAGLDVPIWHQIHIDVPRTNPGIPLWQFPATQKSLERILYVWAIRHPASGYVQGINDLVTPFFQVFLSSYIDADPEVFDVGSLPPEVLAAIEADSFWSLSKLLDGIQDNYIFAQPGIQRQVARMKELCKRVDAPLYRHLEEQNVEFIQFAFRWMNCLLMRELSTKNIIRMWDTYLAEGASAFSDFHLYVCIAFLVRWSEQLRSMEFQEIIIFLQSLPTEDWHEKDTELLLSEAFMWSSLFHNASGHFERK